MPDSCSGSTRLRLPRHQPPDGREPVLGDRPRSEAARIHGIARRPRRRATSSRHGRPILDECLKMIEEDNRVCRAIGEHGLEAPEDRDRRSAQSARSSPHPLQRRRPARGAVRHGPAPIYVGASGVRFHVFADETRPLLQGSRITAFELQRERHPGDGHLRQHGRDGDAAGKVQAVIVGTDRIAANGDVGQQDRHAGGRDPGEALRDPVLVAAPISSDRLATDERRADPDRGAGWREIRASAGRRPRRTGWSLQPGLRRDAGGAGHRDHHGEGGGPPAAGGESAETGVELMARQPKRPKGRRGSRRGVGPGHASARQEPRPAHCHADVHGTRI